MGKQYICTGAHKIWCKEKHGVICKHAANHTYSDTCCPESDGTFYVCRDIDGKHRTVKCVEIKNNVKFYEVTVKG